MCSSCQSSHPVLQLSLQLSLQSHLQFLSFIAVRKSCHLDSASIKLEGKALDSDLDLVRGTLDVLVLKSLVFGARHGYDVARWIFDTSKETLVVDEGALYTSLHRMENRGWLESEWGISDNNRRAKFYQLTAKGRSQLKRSTADWTRYAEAVFLVLRAV